MTSEKEKLEELLDSIKPDESPLTVNNHSKEEVPGTTKPEEEDKGIPASADPEPAKTLEELDHPFYTDDPEPFSDETGDGFRDSPTNTPITKNDIKDRDSSIETEFPDTNQNRKRQSQGQRRQQPANQQGSVFIYNPQIVIQNGGERR